MIARFVDIGGIIDHHCFNVLFIKCSELLLLEQEYSKLIT